MKVFAKLGLLLLVFGHVDAGSIEETHFYTASFDDRPEIASLLSEIHSHPFYIRGEMYSISLGYSYLEKDQAEDACAWLKTLGVRAVPSGFGSHWSCIASADLLEPTGADLESLRGAVEQMASIFGGKKGSWLISRLASDKEIQASGNDS